MRSLQKPTSPERDERFSSFGDGRSYSRIQGHGHSRASDLRPLFQNPIIGILRRIDEVRDREEALRMPPRQPNATLSELEACLAALQHGA